jgi:hypothetical protein
MITLDQLHHYFKSDLSKSIREYETERLEIISRYSYRTYKRILMVLITSAVAFIIAGIVLPSSPFKWGSLLLPLTALFAIVYPIVLSAKRHRATRTLVDEYRSTVMGALLSKIDDGLQYRTRGNMTSTDVDNTLLFDGATDYYMVEDEVAGQGRFAGFLMTKITLEERSRSSTGHSGRLTGADGLVIRHALQESIDGYVVIHSDTFSALRSREDVIGQVAVHINSLLTALTPGVVEFSDPEFSKAFKVFSDTEPHALAILTKHRRDELLKLRKALGSLSISFVGSTVTFFVDGAGLGHINYLDSFQHFEQFEEYLRSLLMAIELRDRIGLTEQ